MASTLPQNQISIINGGTVNITGQSAFDYDGTATLNGGKLIVNGQETTTITNQFMGGGMMGGGMMNGAQGQQMPAEQQAQGITPQDASGQQRQAMKMQRQQ